MRPRQAVQERSSSGVPQLSSYVALHWLQPCRCALSFSSDARGVVLRTVSVGFGFQTVPAFRLTAGIYWLPAGEPDH